MHIISELSELRATVANWRRAGLKVAFVPTMGNLHAGHFKLVDEARKLADKVIVSIFVNPMQFGPSEDLAKYPRTLQADCDGLTAHQADAVFTPAAALIYPRGLDTQTAVEVPKVGDLHCGASRPGHFRGVATIVTKLFNLVQPDVALFGKKDYQQLAVIRRFTEDLSFPIEIIGVDTERAADGLALSSRNGYLTPELRATAPLIYQQLLWLQQQITSGFADFRALEQQVAATLQQAGFRPDYVHICDRQSLDLADSHNTPLVILLAAYLGNTRLIDNLEV
ncbi:pantoate--beta-alanine ligase [Rheinheimera riviphila]|uniref:Pantothenate synthetase n=1 Tax=Rheinheimera riviphila TaxID=1834037 RepID=A0A437R4V0_9GAMM|nr:pantoate--beta-alanine ligase [Rheinheimera riviphila]RVU41745.1 pantoate--beta-alanine ligase [Rheinheimera riviphila]